MNGRSHHLLQDKPDPSKGFSLCWLFNALCSQSWRAVSTVTRAQIFEDDGQYANSFSAKSTKNNGEVVMKSGDVLLILFTLVAYIKSTLPSFWPARVVLIIDDKIEY